MPPRSLNPSGSNDAQEAMEMLTGEMARYRIDDRVRAAQTDRLARSTRAGRTADARSGTRRVVTTIAAALLWPIRH
ncbi:MAG TPA: hypothetical protein VI411_03390 [Actinomycetota bacterium]|jgi:hypothetical protein